MGNSLVHDYWQAHPCAAKLADHEQGSRAFFAEVEAAKDRLDGHERAFAEFGRWRDRDVLEVGCGVGIDTARFARAGARISAVDLTEAAVELTTTLLSLDGLPGRATVADAEALPFDDASFDLVYSWGVLHHTANIERAVAEVRRVLRPDGEARVMLYCRTSVFALAVWLRQLARNRSPLPMRAALATGLESPGTRAFSRTDARSLFAGFRHVEVKQVATRYDRLRLDPLGWHLLVRAEP